MTDEPLDVRSRRDWPLRAGALTAWGLLATIQIVLSFAGQSGSTQEDSTAQPIYHWTLAVSSLILYAILLGITWAIANGDRDGLANALGLRRFAPRILGLAAGVVVLSIVIGAVLEPILHAGDKQGLTPDAYDSSRLAPLIVNSLVIVTLVPFAEELFFRGLGVRLLGPLGVLPAVVGTGLVFGLAHGIPEALPPLVVFGIGLAYVRWKADSVWPGVIAHGVYNAIGIAAALAAS